MEFQSYSIYYSNDEQRNEILQMIKQHNEYGKTCDVEDKTVGGELYRIINAELHSKPDICMRDKIYFTYKLGNEPIGVIICCNEYGRTSTMAYFDKFACLERIKRHYIQCDKNTVNVININNL